MTQDQLKILLTELAKKNSWGKNEIKDLILNIIANFNPPSTTALQELINDVERRTIERCASKLDDMAFYSASFVTQFMECAATIRALPTGNLKLEDLK